MKNFDKILLYTNISYILFSIFSLIFGISNVNAASYNGSNYTAKLYDNVNGTLTSVTTNGPFNGGLYEGYIAYAANSSGGAWIISSPITLVANHTYSLTASIPNECGSLVLSSVNRIGVGTNSNNAKASYQNNTDVNENYSRVVGGSNFLIQFAFTPTINGSYIVFPFATSVSCGSSRTILESIVIDDLGINSATQEQINTSLTNQTNELNNSIQNSTDTIINNQNQNNEEIKDTINDNFNSCRPSVNLFNYSSTNFIDSGNISLSGTANDFTISATGGGIVRAYYLTNINFNTLYRYMSSNYVDNSILLAVTNSNSYSSWSDYASDRTIINWNMNNNSQNLSNYQGKYLWVQLRGSVAQEYYSVNYKDLVFSKTIVSKYEPYGEEICTNKIDETNNQLGDLNNSLNNSDSSGATNDASNFFSNFTTDTFGLTSIITAPLSLINNLTSSSCSTLRLPIPYLDNKFLELPCMETIYTKYFGSFFNIYQTITFGIVAYWVIVRIFNQVKDFKNPDHDEIEVLDL